MSPRILFLIGSIIFPMCLLFISCDDNVETPSVRSKIITALSAEIPKAQTHFGAHPLAVYINESFLTKNNVLIAAEALLGQTRRDNLFGNAAVPDQEGKILISVSSLPLGEGGWQQALAKFQDANFERTSKHFAAQAAESNRQSLTSIQGIIHVYLGSRKNGDIVAAIGLCEMLGTKRCLKPRQFPDKVQPPTSDNTTISLKDLPSKRCDIDTEGELILPGQGYLLSAQEVAQSQSYWNSLSPQTAAIVRASIRTDTSPWLVSEKHISKFDIDKSKARQRAVQMWNEVLKRAIAARQ